MRRSTKRDARARQGQALYVSLLNDSDHDATHTTDSPTMHSIPKVSHDDDDDGVLLLMLMLMLLLLLLLLLLLKIHQHNIS